ncbi:hypothetical protein GRI89_05445 [Altererythrobacter salegens]|uniref:DUF8021 domain-containing protein n=1 Tax=Croceibacterium salegens TaxID=1737568 RepID=A0A6I4SVA7_9SPHN|nr:hypothetical protein [Croceibacterium salegens]MXO58980.1 hypothetical protein [Croceibacterium salegens]
MATRHELYGALDRYLAALLAQDHTRLDWADGALTTENNVALEQGDGLWQTVTGIGPYDLRFADEQTGQVALFTTVTETNDTSGACIRIRYSSASFAEVETIVVRQKDEALVFPDPKFETKPVMETPVPEAERSRRDEMIALADGYFSTLQLNDGTIRTRFHPGCNRIENGVQTTNNPDFFVPVAHLGCEEQFAQGNYRYDDRLRGRRFPLVDEERGIVLAHGFIDHCGKLGEYELTDGTKVTSPIRRPHTFYLSEAFKIREGAIEQIEANFITVPYHMPSPWDSRA